MLLPALLSLSLAADPIVLKVEPFPDTAALRALPAKDVKVQASSTLCEGKSKKVCHAPANLLDGKLDTPWCEGAKGKGDGESLTFEFAQPVEVGAVKFVPYFAKDMRRAKQNARPAELTAELEGQTYVIELEDLVWKFEKENGPKPKPPPCGDETCASQDERVQSGESLTALFPKGKKTKKLKLTVDLFNSGEKYEDGCMSELSILVR